MNNQLQKEVIASKQFFKLNFPEKKYNKNKSKSKLVVKYWSFKALGIFDKTNCMKKYFLVNSVLILVRTI